MAVAQVLLLAAGLLHCSSALPASSQFCTHLSPAQLNCSSSGLPSVPQPIPDSVAELDLTNNQLDSVTLNWPLYYLRNVWLGNNSITHLSLCIDRNSGSHYVTGTQLLQMRTWRRRGCVPWAPSLQLLSAERNQLEQLPEGLEVSSSLQVLQLSFNKISTLKPRQLSHLRQLKELHLQHNFITSLHPQMFKDLAQLQVLDLSFNMLTSLHPQMYLSLHNLEANIHLAGNRWNCDCSMRSLRRWMVYGRSRGMHAWSVVCASPNNLSGRDLLQLADDDLNCSTTKSGLNRHQDVTVVSGSEILLSCSTQDSIAWTPSGQVPVSQPEAGLFIMDVTEKDTGLYVCVSEEQEVVSVFNLQISKVGGTHRKTRSLPESSQQIIPQSETDQERNQRATQSDLALAVCLSIFFTFLVAFILGVLARPCVDVLWKRVTKKKSATVTNTVSTVEQGQYDNEAYCDIEESQMQGGHRERRVTFSTVEVLEDNNVQYYDTVARDQDSVNDGSVFEYDTAEGVRERARDSESDGRSSPEGHQRDARDLSGVTVDPDKRRSSSSSSDSSRSDEGNNDEQTRPKVPQLVDESLQQRANISTPSGDLPHISIESTHEIPGFSSEPFAGWSPHVDPNQWQDNEEQFEFSDSVRSISPRSSSVIGSFNDSKLVHKQRRGDTSSSSSYLSENETTHYTVNSDREGEDAIMPSPGFNQGEPSRRKANSSSSSSSDSDEEGHKVKQAMGKGVVKVESDKISNSVVTTELENTEKVKPVPLTRRSVPSLSVSTQGKGLQTGTLSAHSSSSSSDSEAKNKDNLESGWPVLNLQHLPHIKRRLDIKVSKPSFRSSASSDSDNETRISIKRPGVIGVTNLSTQKPSTLVDLSSDSSFSSDSEDDSRKQIQKQEVGQTHTAELPLQKSPKSNHVPQTQWPLLDLGHTTSVKRRLDIKVKSQAMDSSCSSDSEDDTLKSLKRPGKVDLAIQKTQTAQKSHSDSSSSSDSEDDLIKPAKKLDQEQLHTSNIPVKGSQTVGHNLESGWPVLNLQRLPRIKRRLDIKVSKPSFRSSASGDSDNETRISIKRPGVVGVTNLSTQKPSTLVDLSSDSSSSSDSEDDTTKQIQKQEVGQTHTAELPLQKSPKSNHVPQTQWPLLDLGHMTSVKRRLDIKVKAQAMDSSSSSDSEDDTVTSLKRPGKVDLAIQKTQTAQKSHSDSSSSSDSEDDSIKPAKKLDQGQLHTSNIQVQGSQTVGHNLESGWPVLNLQHLPRIKRRLDIKASKPSSSSSTSSDSDNETRVSIKRPGEIGATNLSTQKPSTLVDLSSDSSSSSDSEDETIKPAKKLDQEQLHTSNIPVQGSQTVGHNLESGWPVLNLQHLPRIKRRLDIKVSKPSFRSSASSDSDNETRISIKRSGVIGATNLATQKSQTLLDLSSDSSSSSDSEDDSRKQIQKQEVGQTHTAELPLQKSPKSNHVPQTQWPLLDLGCTTSVKRRLDIKVKSQEMDSLSSSDSEDDTINSLKRPGKVDLAIQKTQTVQKSHTDSSSSSDSEDDSIKPAKKLDQGQLHTSNIQVQGTQTVGHNLESGWPVLNLQHLPRIKRRLDIKASEKKYGSSSSSNSEDETRISIKRPVEQLFVTQKSQIEPTFHSESSSSSDSEDEVNKLKYEHRQEHEYVASRSPSFKPHLSNVKAPGPQQSTLTSSSSESEDESMVPSKLRLEATDISLTTDREIIESPKSPVIDIPLRRKTDPNIKLKKYNVITEGSVTTSPEINPELESRWATMNLGISRFRRRLEITSRAQEPPKVPSSPPPVPSSSSSSESDNEGESSRTSQKKKEVKVQRMKYTGSSQKPEITPVPVSPFSKGHNESLGTVDLIERQERPLQREASSSSDSGKDRIDHRAPDLSLGVPRVKRRLNVLAPAPQPGSSSSSSSDSETKETGYSAKQSRPVLNMPQNRSTDTLITYKRSIFQATSPTSSSPPSTSQSLYDTKQRYSEIDHEHRSYSLRGSGTSAGAKKSQSRSFDDLLKKMVGPSKRTTELPPELKWTGVGREMPDRPVSTPGSRLDVSFISAPAEPELPPPSSSSSYSSESDDEMKQGRMNLDVTQEHKYASLSAVTASSASARTFDTVDNSSISTNQILWNVSEEKRERRGLSALKAMSSEIQQWDTSNDHFENKMSLSENRKVETSSHYQTSTGYTKSMATQSEVYLPSASVYERRATDMSHEIPSYRWHGVGGIDPPQETPPPIPATPPPSDEAVGYTWKSRPNSWKQRSEGTGYYVRKSRYTVETDHSSLTSQNLEDFLDTSKNPITEV